MAMVDVDTIAAYRRTGGSSWLACPKVGGRLHSSNKPWCTLAMAVSYEDSTIKIAMFIIIINNIFNTLGSIDPEG